MLESNVEEIVRELNLFLWDIHEEGIHVFSYETDGTYQLVKFDEIVLWGSADEDREFNEEDDKFEDLTVHIKRKFNEYIDTIHKLRF